ncbi:hypothetical protein A2810_01640 [candidate division Kazan bacterium RIFCSPHIGHO2_01_FULL_49_10]|uniref:Uncharacterized protein n=1 Tax=candidate division Kazan bacterium RIFCSPLOWO2_01_FULL_48_13 TaxID=1798539 RepID=A0A1F4PN23_UNCK3|nr:MAG: hypothetical protein A2810_01640 [candidate division Kazan bacterium RIFCSPHIGHO2_01_FULL_49_10]OGB85038.1 MAG: hypothetical protein A2994_00275 [candidate division Kazan bacterium RIFCSPLOWO2_01_FULL_48_13]
MESIRVQRRRPRTKRDVLTTGGQHDYYVANDDLNKLVKLLGKPSRDQIKPLLLSLLTKKELSDIVRRLLIAEMALNGLTYEEIANRMGSGKNVIALVKQSLASNGGVLTRLLNPGYNISGTAENYFINRLKQGK